MDDRPPPIIRLGPSNQTLAENSVAALPCRAAGNPTPTIKWLVVVAVGPAVVLAEVLTVDVIFGLVTGY